MLDLNNSIMKLEDIKTGSFLYYTERPHSDYADGLVEVRERDGIQYPFFLCVNWEGKYEPQGELQDYSLPISSFYDERCWRATNYDGSDVIDWMTKNYPLGEPSPITDTQRLDWLMSMVSGKEYRRIGIEYGAGINRQAIDFAMEQEQKLKSTQVQPLIQDQDYEPS